jgi:uncharacterized protein (TIGR00266 family)
MNEAKLHYTVVGKDIQLVELTLQPEETVIAEAGAMICMDDGISFDVRMSDGSHPQQSVFSKLVTAGKRMVGGDSFFLTHFKNTSDTPRRVSFSSSVPGRVIPIDLSTVGCDLICQKDCFMTAELGVTLDVVFTKRLGFGMFGGGGFVLQKLGGEGMAFIGAGGNVVERNLDDEKIIVGTGCVVAFDSCIDYEIQRSGRLKSMIFGGEGLFLATLSGTGRVWIQSLPISKLADHLSGMVED